MAFEELTSRHAVMWGSAPFENIAHLIEGMHVALVERLAPVAGERWLDLGCGVGDVAFHAARAGATVTGSDLSPTLVETARHRAAEYGLELTLEVADCQNLPYPDASFDVVSSSVGVIFAPDHARVAIELARVCRPGGRVGLTAWRKESGVGAMFGAMAPFMPTPPPGAGSPLQWGDETYVESSLGGAFDLTFEELEIPQTGEDGTGMWTFFRDNFGPSYTLWHSLDTERRAELDTTMEAFFESYRSGDVISVERRYIVATGVRK
ncbi:class I SAM-dependent methyltransferase [Gaiella sp.]|uniref:class I SAM-dependent methyltransferase n=1 Tax=Gaiella sp. TaxID=2663207 RepID=UPI0032660CDE